MYTVAPWAIALLVFFIIVLPLMWWSRQRRLALVQFTQGLAYVKALRVLLTHIQQHRGLTTGYLSGNRDLSTDITQLEKHIARDLQELKSLGGWLEHNAMWLSILDHWGRLRQHYSENDVNQNLRQHNLLIHHLMYLIDDVAEAHRLKRNVAQANEPQDWRDLLVIAEAIGQARALGTGVAAQGQCTSVQRIQLYHLCHKIEQLLQQPLPDPIRAAVKQLLVCIQNDMVLDRPVISAQDYFKLASASLDQVLRLFDGQIDRLRFSP